MTLNDSILTCRRLYSYAAKYWRLIAVTALMTIIYSALSRGPATFIKPLMDDVLIAKRTEDIWGFVLGGIVITIGIFLTNMVKDILKRYVMLRVLVDIRVAVCRHLLTLSLRFFHATKAGDLISRVTNDIAITQVALEYLFDDALLQPCLFIAGVAVAAHANWQLTLMCLPLVVIFAWPVFRLGKQIRKSKLKSLVKLSDLTEDIQQILSGIRIVKSFHMEKQEVVDFERSNQAYLRKTMKVIRSKALSASAVELMSALTLVIFFCLGAWLIMDSSLGLTPGGLMQFISAMILLRDPVRSIAKTYNSLMESFAGAERVFELLDTKPDLTDAPGATRMGALEQGVRFNLVGFSYGVEPVLQDVDLLVPRGSIVAIVGPSGAGKSTMLDLVARFYDPQSGSVEMDGKDLRSLTRESILGHIAVVSQDTFLFNTSIGENIRYGRPEASQAEVEAAARAANIHEFVVTLPEKYATTVGERGAKLSGGQRQRIAIARAILKDPAILLLDEATSALDSESESLVQEAINNLMKGRTTLVIAHRLSTIQHADLIVVLENGRIVERGRHAELLERDGAYRRMNLIQSQATGRSAQVGA